MKYAYVKNGIVQYTGSLPENWNNISGLRYYANDFSLLKSLGWYLVEKQEPTYDPSIEKLSEAFYTILPDKVIEYFVTIPLTQEEIDSKNQFHLDDFWNHLRTERDRLLQESDWTQMFDVRKNKSEEWITAWELYRQALRDLPDTVTKYNISSISWPTKPNFQ